MTKSITMYNMLVSEHMKCAKLYTDSKRLIRKRAEPPRTPSPNGTPKECVTGNHKGSFAKSAYFVHLLFMPFGHHSTSFVNYF